MLKLNDDEATFLSNVLSEPANMNPKLLYADWLQEQGDARGDFLREYCEALLTMSPGSFPDPNGFDLAWLDLIGFPTMQKLAELEGGEEYRDAILQVLEPAIRIDTEAASDSNISVGTSKYGGLPDLAPTFNWPQGKDCPAIYNNDTAGVERLAGFLMQMNLVEAQASRFVDLPLPKSGLLSFFCYHDDDDVDCIGVNCFHFPEIDNAGRISPPVALSEGNELQEPKRILFRECLRIPPEYSTDDDKLGNLIWQLWELVGNQALFGVRDFQTDEPHFIGIDKDDVTTVFINVSPDISEVDLTWVEFDGDTGFK